MGIIADMYKTQGRRGRMKLVEHHDPDGGVYYVREKIWSKPRPARATKPARTRRQQTSARRTGTRARRTSSSAAASGDGDGDSDSDSDREPARTRRTTPTPTPPAPVSRRVLRISDVMLITGLARPTVYKLIGSGDFPAPIKLGSAAAGWLAHEIDAWLDACIAERDAGVQS